MGTDQVMDMFDQIAVAVLILPQSILRRPALGDVAVISDDSLYARLGQQVLASALQPAPRAVFMPITELSADYGAGLPQQLGKPLGDVGQVIGVDEFDKQLASALANG